MWWFRLVLMSVHVWIHQEKQFVSNCILCSVCELLCYPFPSSTIRQWFDVYRNKQMWHWRATHPHFPLLQSSLQFFSCQLVMWIHVIQSCWNIMFDFKSSKAMAACVHLLTESMTCKMQWSGNYCISLCATGALVCTDSEASFLGWDMS